MASVFTHFRRALKILDQLEPLRDEAVETPEATENRKLLLQKLNKYSYLIEKKFKDLAASYKHLDLPVDDTITDDESDPEEPEPRPRKKRRQASDEDDEMDQDDPDDSDPSRNRTPSSNPDDSDPSRNRTPSSAPSTHSSRRHTPSSDGENPQGRYMRIITRIYPFFFARMHFQVMTSNWDLTNGLPLPHTANHHNQRPEDTRVCVTRCTESIPT